MTGSRKYLLAVLLCLTTAGALWCFGFFVTLFQEETVSAVCTVSAREITVSARGLFFREYIPIRCDCAHTAFLLPDGEKVGKDALLGYGYDTASEGRSALLACVALQGEDRAPARASDMAEAVRAYARALSRKDGAGVLWYASVLSGYAGSDAFPSGDAGANARLLRAEAGGIFVSGTPACLSCRQLPAALEDWVRLWSLSREESVPGYIITGSRWYFAAVTEETDAARLTPGQVCSLRFEGCSALREATLTALLPGEGEQVLAVFSSTAAPGDELFFRCARAEILLERKEGLSVPVSALMRTDGGTFVYRLSPLGSVSVEVEVLYEDSCNAIVASAGLRSGSRVALSPSPGG